MKLADTIAGVWNGQFGSWIDRRIPRSRTVTLNLRNVFIFPTREGFAFGLLLILLLLGAINYQNSLVFAFTFLLGSLFVVGILHTYRNLAGVTIELVGSRGAFAGEDAEFDVGVSQADLRVHEGLCFGWPGSIAQMVDLVEGEARLKLFVHSTRRGWLLPGRLLVESRFPLGLLRAWTWIDLDARVVVYPHPLNVGRVPAVVGTRESGAVLVRDGSDDFVGMREYVPGDSPRRINWKSWARGAGLQVKEFGGYADRRLWLDWESLSGLDTETRLSRLCGWALQAAREHDDYGLRLPGITIEPDQGDRHRDEVLKTLALFQAGEVQAGEVQVGRFQSGHAGGG